MVVSSHSILLSNSIYLNVKCEIVDDLGGNHVQPAVPVAIGAVALVLLGGFAAIYWRRKRMARDQTQIDSGSIGVVARKRKGAMELTTTRVRVEPAADSVDTISLLPSGVALSKE